MSFLDEPATGPATEARRTTWELVRGPPDEGATIVLTTHSLEEAEEPADRLAERGVLGRGDGRAHAPEVAVLDLQMAGADGVAVATSLRADVPGCRSMMVTGHGRPGHLKRALVAGVRGFAPRTVSARRPAEIIRTAHAGNRDVDPELAADASSAGGSPLTVREAEVLEFAAARGAGHGDRGAGVAVAGDGAQLPLLGRRQAGCGEPPRGGAARPRARLAIVVPAPRGGD